MGHTDVEHSVSEVLEKTNELLCENNQAEMFVAADAFVGTAEPFDDMTMMYLEYLGPEAKEQKEK
jgi:hypothetical protein